jgi:hypothetical protein
MEQRPAGKKPAASKKPAPSQDTETLIDADSVRGNKPRLDATEMLPEDRDADAAAETDDAVPSPDRAVTEAPVEAPRADDATEVFTARSPTITSASSPHRPRQAPAGAAPRVPT